jgi:hypothetical protein
VGSSAADTDGNDTLQSQRQGCKGRLHANIIALRGRRLDLAEQHSEWSFHIAKLLSRKISPSVSSFFVDIWTRRNSARKVREGGTSNDIFAFLTTEPNAIVAPIHPKAMRVLLARAQGGARAATAAAGRRAAHCRVRETRGRPCGALDPEFKNDAVRFSSWEREAMSDEKEGAEQFGRRLVERMNSDPKQWAPLLHAAVALELCLEKLVERLTLKGSLGAQEFLDILVGASDSIRLDPAGAVAVEKIEDLCRDLAAIPGVELRPAKPAISDEAAIPETPKDEPYDGSPV